MSASDAHTILVVDDDDALAEMIGLVLAQEGFNAVFCENGGRAFETFMRSAPDLVLLDLMLPGMNGIEVCQQIRRSSNVPIIMLTAKSDTEDVVKGLEAGADDYIAKPFKHAELLARIRTRLRPRESRQLVVSIGDIVMDMDGRTVKYHSTEVPMTPLEFDLLAALVRHPGQALSRQELLDMVWGYTDVSDSLVNVHVQRLRAKFDELGADRFIQTVRGDGYKIPTEQVGSSGS
ncbi:MtrAB system response regulator MtrA [Rothia mucilaginosa]|uniref:MtrAB system response regulator MtrA n=1 Tax=Rothia mucilaginosa TaxID=43675 RepID=UPI003C797483